MREGAKKRLRDRERVEDAAGMRCEERNILTTTRETRERERERKIRERDGEQERRSIEKEKERGNEKTMRTIYSRYSIRHRHSVRTRIHGLIFRVSYQAARSVYDIQIA